MFLGMETNPKGCFLGGMGRGSLVVFEGKKVGFFKFSKELFFWWCGMSVWRKWIQIYLFIYLFWDIGT
jgi:hypothetical protein